MPQAKPVAGRWLVSAPGTVSCLLFERKLAMPGWKLASSTLSTTSWRVHTWSVLVTAEKSLPAPRLGGLPGTLEGRSHISEEPSGLRSGIWTLEGSERDPDEGLTRQVLREQGQADAHQVECDSVRPRGRERWSGWARAAAGGRSLSSVGSSQEPGALAIGGLSPAGPWLF